MGLTGKVKEVRDGWVHVEVFPRADCQGCTACSGLMTDGKPQAKVVRALAETVTPKVGDEVRLEVDPGYGSLAAFLVFGLPLVGFFVGVFLGGYIPGWLGWSPLGEGWALVCGLIGLFIPWFILAGLSSRGHFRKLSLKVTEIIAPSEVEPASSL
jgi:positive regulator of sigma E activity